MFYGQIKIQNYLQDPSISFCAIGDATCDEIPLQVSDFGQGKEIDQLISKMVLFRSGGGNDHESYEMGSYFYLNYCDLQSPEFPFFFITGDEGYWDNLDNKLITQFIGREFSSNEKIDSFEIWQKLKGKFNVFLIKKKYGTKEVIQWNSALGEERVLNITNPKAVVDIILGAIALTTGERTMETYIQDMNDRDQSQERIDEVTKALKLYNEKLLTGEVEVIRNPKVRDNIKFEFDFSEMRQEIEKILLNNIPADKLNFYKGLKIIRSVLADKVPREMVCPITGELFYEPVSTSDGFTFEKQAIEFWFSKKKISPVTGRKLNNNNLIPNFVIKKLVNDYFENNKNIII